MKAHTDLTVVGAPTNNNKEDLQAGAGEYVKAPSGAPEVVGTDTGAQFLSSTNRNMHLKVLCGLLAFNLVFTKHMSSIMTNI